MTFYFFMLKNKEGASLPELANVCEGGGSVSVYSNVWVMSSTLVCHLGVSQRE